MGAEVVSCIRNVYCCNGSVSYIVRIGGAKSCARSSLRGRLFTCYVKMSWEGAVGGRPEGSTKIFTIFYVGGLAAGFGEFGRAVALVRAF